MSRKPMTEKHVFAAVDLPFHVWVKEGSRWVLRDAAQRMQETSAPAGTSAGASPGATAAGGSR
ncbi:MAG: hypothetical protein ACXWG1_18940 [Usitatibacter sp.]